LLGSPRFTDQKIARLDLPVLAGFFHVFCTLQYVVTLACVTH
jgi:hypothetical protein